MKYEINGKDYTQKPLVLGQVIPLSRVLKDKLITDISPLALIEIFGPELPRIMAILLIPDGIPLKDRDLEAQTQEFTEHLGLETAMRVIEDFFLFNSIASLSAQFRKVMTTIWQQTGGGAKAQTG